MIPRLAAYTAQSADLKSLFRCLKNKKALLPILQTALLPDLHNVLVSQNTQKSNRIFGAPKICIQIFECCAR